MWSLQDTNFLSALRGIRFYGCLSFSQRQHLVFRLRKPGAAASSIHPVRREAVRRDRHCQGRAFQSDARAGRPLHEVQWCRDQKTGGERRV